jgi:hypothetical protein
MQLRDNELLAISEKLKKENKAQEENRLQSFYKDENIIQRVRLANDSLNKLDDTLLIEMIRDKITFPVQNKTYSNSKDFLVHVVETEIRKLSPIPPIFNTAIDDITIAAIESNSVAEIIEKMRIKY